MAGDLLAAARSYAAQGIPILPLWWVREDGSCACRQPGCDSQGKHPLGKLVPYGLKDATTDLARIERWWAKEPKANVGILTGRASDIVVLDVDPRHGGGRSLDALLKEHGPLPEHAISRTGGGGSHHYFAHPGGLVPSAPGLRPGLDLKGEEGYVVAPVSRTKGEYTWVVPLDKSKLPPLPPWLLKAVTEGSRRQKPLDATPEGEPLEEGRRNDELARIAGKLRRDGAVKAAIVAQLREVNAARCRPPLGDEEIETIAKSIMRYPPKESPKPKPVAENPELGRPSGLAASSALEALKLELEKCFGLKDLYPLEVVLAAYNTRTMPDDPLWAFLVGPPSSLKTEVLRWSRGTPSVHTLSTLTPGSLVSGLKDGHDLLPLLNGKLLVIKDFTSILEMHREAREVVLAQLRDCFDGYYEKAFGTVGQKSFDSRFNLVAGVTTAIEGYYTVWTSLGQRFLIARVPLVASFKGARGNVVGKADLRGA